MKKTLILLGIILLTANFVNAAETNTQNYKHFGPPPRMSESERAQKEAEFEKRLGLTEEQKAQAKQLRQQGFEKMKPIMDEMHTKRQEINAIKNSENLTQKRTELQELDKKAREIRKQNMKDFESILTDDQKKTLKEMKQEGRQKYHKNHPPQFGPQRKFNKSKNK